MYTLDDCWTEFRHWLGKSGLPERYLFRPHQLNEFIMQKVTDPTYATLVMDLFEMYQDENWDDISRQFHNNEDYYIHACEESTNVLVLCMAALWYGAAHKGALCLLQLGELYFAGKPVPQDYTKARHLFEFAAAQSAHGGFEYLARIYEDGLGVAPDAESAFKYNLLSAIIGQNHQAYFKLSEAFRTGAGVKKDLLAATALVKYSYSISESFQDGELAALRLAQISLSSVGTQLALERNLLQSLKLYSAAEIGIRLAIREGRTDYEPYLQECLEGIEYVHQLLDQEEQRKRA